MRAVLSGLDVGACTREILGWLSTHADVEGSLCAVVDTERRAMVGLAGDGIPHSRVETFVVDLGDEEDPLVLALQGRETMQFAPRPGSERFPVTPLGETPFQAVPLRFPDTDDGWPLGLLLVTGVEAKDDPAVSWAARLLGLRLLLGRVAELRASERRARREHSLASRVLDSIVDPILLTDAEGRMLFANKSAERLLAAGSEDSEGRRRAVALNNMLLSASLFTATVQGGPLRRELTLVDPIEGQDLLYELISNQTQDPEHGEDGAVSILRDVQDLRRATEEIEENYGKLRLAEADVRAERDRLDLIINAVADPVLVTDEGGKIVLMNPPAENLFTASGKDRNASERVIRANDVVFSSFVSDLYTLQTLRLRTQLELGDPATGRPLPVEAIAGKVIAKEGRVAGIVTILHDRTEALEKAALYEQVKRHSEELREKVREATSELSHQNELLRRQAIALEEASEAKSRFFANMSHELRTPLNAITGYAHLFMEGILGDLSDLQKDKLERIDANARHLVSLIDDLLDIARIESDRLPVHVEPFDVVELVEEIMAEMEPLIARSRLTVTTATPRDIPRAQTDRKKVKQVLVNLLSNAIKFTPEGFIRLHCSHDPGRDELAIAVTDTGIGIPLDQQASIFEAFHQADASNTRRHGGTGLGLTICKRLADVVGGGIRLASRPGAGSTFTLHFPRRFPREER